MCHLTVHEGCLVGGVEENPLSDEDWVCAHCLEVGLCKAVTCCLCNVKHQPLVMSEDENLTCVSENKRSIMIEVESNPQPYP